VTGPAELLARVERTLDAFPRRPGVRVEAVGPFDLFVRDGAGWPFYARPRLGAADFTDVDVAALLARQRALDVPEAIEWVVDVTPGLLERMPERLPVRLAPLMVLDPQLLPAPPHEALLLDPADPDFPYWYARSAAVAAIGFGHPGTQTGAAGPAERDAEIRPVGSDLLDEVAAARRVDAVVVDPVDGVVARGTYQYALGAAEIVGVATLPAARRQGHAATLAATLARHALAHGNDLVFLSASDETVARMYARVGFRRVGTAAIAQFE
jgi:ribosomal protein S18 acetylase RimI-like enzyme